MKRNTISIATIFLAAVLLAAGCNSTKNNDVAGINTVTLSNESLPAQANMTKTSTNTTTKDTQDQKQTDEIHKQTDSTSQVNTQIDYAFTRSKEHPEKLLIGVIDGAKTNLDIAIYSLTNQDIVKSILAAKKRGVAVRMLTDESEAKTATQAKIIKNLRAVSIPIKENKHSGLMHMKVTIADKSVVTTGSYNYTNAATTTNDEVLVIIHNPKIAQDWDKEFEAIWSDKVNYKDVK